MKELARCFRNSFPVFLLLLISATVSFAETPHSEKLLWQGIKSGQYFAAMRHALAPGMGDPDEFVLNQCETQRNLSEEGVAQAQRIGKRFKDNGVSSARVFTSQWCRCRDTAAALSLGPVEDLSALNSFFQDFELREPQTQELLSWLRSQKSQEPTVLVSHQVNISALLGVGTTSGEIVVFEMNSEGDPVSVGTIATP